MQLKIISNKYISNATDSEYTLLFCMMAIPLYKWDRKGTDLIKSVIKMPYV